MIRNVSNLDHKFYINDPHIRKCFPLLERGLLRASRLIKCGCGKFEYSFVDDLLKETKENQNFFVDIYYKHKHNG